MLILKLIRLTRKVYKACGYVDSRCLSGADIFRAKTYVYHDITYPRAGELSVKYIKCCRKQFNHWRRRINVIE